MRRDPGSRLLAFADAIFGRDGRESEEPRRWLLRYLGVGALLAAVVAARRLDAVTNPQFWGEDGFLYFRENLTLGFPRAAENFYMGFPHLGQRLVAFIGAAGAVRGGASGLYGGPGGEIRHGAGHGTDSRLASADAHIGPDLRLPPRACHGRDLSQRRLSRS